MQDAEGHAHDESCEARPPVAHSAGLQLAISRGWLVMHESGTYVKFTPSGADLFA
jgi:hypothetical protein